MERRFAGAVLALACMLGCAAPAQASGGGLSGRAIISDLNGERHFAGLPPVRDDPRLSAECAAHNRYLSLNNDGNGDPHREIRGRPGYSAAGARAGEQSDLARLGYYSAGRSPWNRSDPFDPAPYHLLELMSPAFTTMGADELITRDGLAYECVNVLGGKRRAPPRHGVKVYEFPGRSPVPRAFVNQEGPHAGQTTGVWLFLWFLAPRGTRVTLRSLSLANRSGHRVLRPLATFVAGGLRDGRPAGARGRVAHRRSISSGFFSVCPAAGFLSPPFVPGDWYLRVGLGAEPGVVTFRVDEP